MIKNLTDLEKTVLPQLFNSSAANGHDFGLSDDVVLLNPKSLGGVMASLAKKGLLTVEEDVVNGRTLSYVYLAEDQLDSIRATVDEIEMNAKSITINGYDAVNLGSNKYGIKFWNKKLLMRFMSEAKSTEYNFMPDLGNLTVIVTAGGEK